MTNLEHARAANRYARERVTRQVNIKPARMDKSAEMQYYEASCKHGVLRKTEGADAFGTWSMGKIVAFAAKVELEGIGNCQELTAVACNYLSQQRVDNFHACILEPPADHVFVVIGQDPVGQRFPDSFRDWNGDAAICDPWADIACLASEYPGEWRNQMRLWSADRRIQAGVDKGARADFGGTSVVVMAPEWIDPQQWGDEPTRRAKICIATSGQNEGTNKCCYITTAACVAMGLGDEAPQLETLRRFRDEVLLRTDEGRRYVERYYRSAPAVVAEIGARADADAIFRRIYATGVVPALAAISAGDHAKALGLLQRFVDRGWSSA